MLVITPATDIDDFRELTLFPRWSYSILITAWEQRKLGDCFEFLKNNTLSRADLNGENGTARNVHYGDILIKFGDCLDGERSDLPFITDDTVLPKFAGAILREGDVIFADTAEDEAAGKCVELRKLPKEPTISGLHTIPARPRFPFGTGYLGHYLNSDAYHRQLLPLMQGIKVISVSKAALQDTQVRFPSLSEQAAIGAALSEIDNLITLHQRKRRNGPFTHPLVWEQRKFSDMYEVNNERNTDCELGYDKTLSIATMTFNGGNGAADDSLNSYKVIRVGDIAFEGHANKVHAYGRFVLNDAGDGLMSPRFSCLRPIVEQRYSFWKYYISHEETMRPILVNATKSGTMMNELVPDDLMRESILVPCLAEQEVIGDSLSHLDALITLHQ